MKHKNVKVVIALGVIVASTGCTSMMGESVFTGENEGRFLLATDAEGMRAFGESLNGLVTTGKASPDVRDAYWQSRDAHNGLRYQFKTRGGKQ